MIVLVLMNVVINTLSFTTCEAAVNENKKVTELSDTMKSNKIDGLIMLNNGSDKPIIIRNNFDKLNTQYVVDTDKYFPIGSLQKILTGYLIYLLVKETY